MANGKKTVRFGIVIISLVSALVGAGIAQFLSASAHAQQVNTFGYVQAQGFTLVKNGFVRGQLAVDGANNTILTLHDPSTQRGLKLMVAPDGNISITDFQGNPLTTASKRLEPVQLITGSGHSGGGKGDSASMGDVNLVRDELNAIWTNLQRLQHRVNQLSQ
jgi:hypothetical protein